MEQPKLTVGKLKEIGMDSTSTCTEVIKQLYNTIASLDQKNRELLIKIEELEKKDNAETGS